jgi:hypothetical protein
LCRLKRQHLETLPSPESNELGDLKSFGPGLKKLSLQGVNPLFSFSSKRISEYAKGGHLHFRHGVLRLFIRFMALRKQILGVGLLYVFVFVVLASSFACADNRPSGVYQRGKAHAGHRAGVGRAAARDFKAGFLVAKNDDSPKLRKNLSKYSGSAHGAARVDSMALLTPETSFSAPRSFILDLSPVLNL